MCRRRETLRGGMSDVKLDPQHPNKVRALRGAWLEAQKWWQRVVSELKGPIRAAWHSRDGSVSGAMERQSASVSGRGCGKCPSMPEWAVDRQGEVPALGTLGWIDQQGPAGGPKLTLGPFAGMVGRWSIREQRRAWLGNRRSQVGHCLVLFGEL